MSARYLTRTGALRLLGTEERMLARQILALFDADPEATEVVVERGEVVCIIVPDGGGRYRPWSAR